MTDKPKRLTKEQKLELAKEICATMGTKFCGIIEPANEVNKCKVRKKCLVDPSHPVMDVSLGSIVSLNRGGCKRCAQIKGGQTGRKTAKVT